MDPKILPSLAPAEIIISILSSLVAFVFSPTVIPLFHRCSPSEKPKVLLGMVIATGLIMAYFANSNVYDAEHPKRIGAQYMYNVSSMINVHISDQLSADRQSFLLAGHFRRNHHASRSNGFWTRLRDTPLQSSRKIRYPYCRNHGLSSWSQSGLGRFIPCFDIHPFREMGYGECIGGGCGRFTKGWVFSSER